jgi:hypothetical protein
MRSSLKSITYQHNKAAEIRPCSPVSVHYRELVKPKEAEVYWNIKPAKVEKILHLAPHPD